MSFAFDQVQKLHKRIEQLQSENERMRKFEDFVWGVIQSEPLHEAGYKIMEYLE